MLISAFFCLGGLWLSFVVDMASGAAIVIVTSACYMLAFPARKAIHYLANKMKGRTESENDDLDKQEIKP